MSEWTLGTELQNLLMSAFTNSNLQPKALELKLIRFRPRFKDILHEEPQTAAKRAEIEQGKVVLNGRTEIANPAFVKQVILLADLLNINEGKAASLLKHSIDVRSTYDRELLEIAIHEYTKERLSVIECLDLMVKGSSSANVPPESRLLFKHHLKELFLHTENIHAGSTTSGSSSTTANIIKSLSLLNAQLEALRDDTVSPGFQTGSQLKKLGITESLITVAVESIIKTRLFLSGLLLSISLDIRLANSDILQLLGWVQATNGSDSVWVPLTVALIAAIQRFEIVEFSADQWNAITQMHKIIFGIGVKWASKELQETIIIAFCLLLKSARAANPKLEEKLELRESIETKLMSSMKSGPFEFIREHIIIWATLDSNVPSVDGEAELEIRNAAYHVLQKMVSDFFRLMGRVVRSLKNEAEDMDMLGDPNKTSAQSGLKQLLNLVFWLYRDRPDEGYCYWSDPDLFKFLKFMMDVKSASILQSYLDILGSFATGPKSSQCAAEFLSSDHLRISWEALFRSIDFTAKSLAAHPDGEMNPDEIGLQRSFLRLLKQVVKFSEMARVSLYSSAHLQVINTLFNLINRRIPVELKSSLFDAVAAFCIPIESGSISDVAPMVWRHLENSEIVSRPQYVTGFHYGSFNNQLISGRVDGIRYDLDQIESQNQTYPETMSFITLLNTLMFAMKPNQLTGVVDGFSTRLGPPGGINHYVHFIVEEVFLKAHNRAFTSVEERWKMMELPLRLIDQCLKSFDCTFASAGADGLDSPALAQLRLDASTISAEHVNTVMISSHPGFSLMLRILSGSIFLKKLFEIVSIDVQTVNQFGRTCIPFASSIKLGLRILLRTFNLQKFIFDVIAADGGQYLKQTPSITGVDQLLAFYKEAVIKIALFINSDVDDEICLLAVNILTVLSQSPIFSGIDTAPGKFGKINRLVSLLSSCDESNQIIGGFVHRLELEEPENILDANLELGAESSMTGLKLDAWRDSDLAVLLYESSPSNHMVTESAGLANLIRLAVLDLLLENLMEPNVFPTITHYLLGYNISSGRKIEIVESSAEKGRRCCLHVILELLREGTEGQKADTEFEIQAPLFYTHPKLSERCFRLLYMICSDQVTSAATMRFLRTTEDFFFKQLEAMPVDSLALVDGVKQSLTSTHLHQRSWLMQLIALELHCTTLIGQRSHSQKLLDMLLISPVPDQAQFGQFSKSKNFDQPLTKMLEIVNSVDFGNGECEKVARDPLAYFGDLDLKQHIQNDEYGYPMYDLRSVHSHLLAKQRQIEKHGNAAIGYDRQRLKAEISIILEELLERNQRIENLGSRIHCIYSWSLIMRTAFGNSFELLTPELREEKAFELLLTIFPKFNAQNCSSDIIEYIAHVILALIQTLHDDRVYQDLLQTSSLRTTDDLPKFRATVDSLQQNILKGLLDGILRPESSPSLRENLYASLLYYLSYTNPDKDISSNNVPVSSDKAARAVNAYRKSLIVGNLNIISNYGGDRLFEIVCRDAATAEKVLKTAAFSLLESLCNLAEHVSSSSGFSNEENIVLSFMVKRNYLRGFISSITKVEDAAIQKLLQTDPPEENWQYLYIFESKMSLFLRLALRRDGVEKLLASGLLEALIDAKFIDERPDLELDRMDSDEHILEVSEIYHMTAAPVFELLLCVVSYGRENANLIERISLFLYNHQETFVAILKNRNAAANAASMQEMESVTSFLSYLGSSRQLVESDIRGSGYTSFHNLIITLLIHYFSMDANSGSKVEATAVERHIQTVSSSLLTYCEVVTEDEQYGSVANSLSLVFASGSEAKQDKSRLSVSLALKALLKFISEYMRASNTHRMVSQKLSDLSRLAIDELNTLAAKSQIPSVDEFGTQQKQQVAAGELKKELELAEVDVGKLLNLINQLLLLVLRYFENVIGADNEPEKNNRYMYKNGLRPEQDKEITKLRNELSAVLDKVGELEAQDAEEESVMTVSQLYANTTQVEDPKRAHMQMMGRKLRAFC